QHGRALGEALADALLLGERIGHGGSENRGHAKARPALHRLALMAWWLAPTSRWRTTLLERRVRPNLSFAVASKDTSKPIWALIWLLGLVGADTGRARAAQREKQTKSRTWLNGVNLLDLNLRACFFQLLLDGFGIRFVRAFLHRLRRAVHEVLGFLQAEARHFAHRLD